MKYCTKELANKFAHLILNHNNSHSSFDTISSCDDIASNSLIFISKDKQIEQAKPSINTANVVVCNAPLFEQLANLFSGCLIAVKNVRLAQALIKQAYHDYQAIDKEWGAIHSSAAIHPSTKIGENCHIGPHCVIGENCVIGDDVVIRSHCVIEQGAIIGNGTVIHPLTNIGYECEIGEKVIIHSGVVIGNEGFGFANDETGAHIRIPHTGIVVIEDCVSIGSNCTIDRATYGETKIGQGCKIDNLCHIAHNVTIGENTLIVAQTGIAGSCTIGKRVIISGQAAISDHKHIGDDAILLHRAGVTSDIPSAEKWAGKPARPLKDYVRSVNLAKTVKKLENRIQQLEKTLSQQKK